MKNKETKRMTARMLAAALAAALCLLAAASSALAAAPAFKLTAVSVPTHFLAGEEATGGGVTGGPGLGPPEFWPQYSVHATNVGSAPTSGPITLTATLPTGLSPVGPGASDIHFFEYTDNGTNTSHNPNITCGVLGQVVTCTNPLEVPLAPGDWAKLVVPVDVAADAPPTLTTVASVQGGGAAEARTATTTTLTPSLPSFDFLPGPGGLSAALTATDRFPATQAGSHPGQLTLDFGFPTFSDEEAPDRRLVAAGHLRDLSVRLPRGMVANPNAIPARCAEAQLTGTTDSHCPLASQIGIVTVATSLAGGLNTSTSPLYNMVPPAGAAAEFAFNALNVNIYVHLIGGVNSAGEYELASDTTNILARESNPVVAVQAALWGDPSEPSYDSTRGTCLVTRIERPKEDCKLPLPERFKSAFLTMPSSCREALSLVAEADSWEDPLLHTRTATLEDPLGNPTPTDGCNQLDFDPSIEAKPTTNLADAPSGLDFSLHVPQDEGFESLATANFRDVKVALPEGMAVNPSSAAGLQACSLTQIGLATPTGASPIHFTEDPASCPDAAKLGTVEVSTPALDHPLKGGVYLASPFDNPFGSLLSIYLDVEDPATGIVAKLAGRVEADPTTGQLVTTFDDNPELPIEEVSLHLFKGPRAPLITPPACATHTTTAEITPWSAPEGADAHLSDSFATTTAASGSGPCPASEGQAANNPTFSAGTISPQAGAYTPFVLKLSREDGTQRLTGLETTLPKGLTGKLAGIPPCPEAAIAQAQARSKPGEGAAELQSPSCLAASQVGSVDVAAGAGITPFHVTGHAYLAGPYKSAPISLVVITPAVAGPFDLGVVVARAAAYIDPETAQIHAVADPLPTILQGIPLDLRSVSLRVDRPGFTLNPTNCSPMAVLATALSAAGQSAALSSPFQVGGCSSLAFKPKLSLKLKGGTKRGDHPALTATLTMPPGGANIAAAQVALPHSEFLDQAHIRTICTRVQFAAKACPAGSVYGYAKAITPLLDQPLEGPVYLRSSNHKLPDVVADLNGQIHVVVAGRVDSIKGGIRNSFEALPDAPVSKFTLSLKGGKKGLLINSRDICGGINRAGAEFSAQSGKVSEFRPALVAKCGGKGKKRQRHGS